MTSLRGVRVVFDLDGTLIHSLGSYAAAGKRLTDELGRPSVSAERYAAFVGRGIDAQVIDLLNTTGGLPEDGGAAATQRFRELYADDPITGVSEFPGAARALQALDNAGAALGVCTQKPETQARQVLEALGMLPPIQCVVGGGTVPGVLKPDRRMLDVVGEHLGTGPLYYVGDSEVDAQTATNAGVSFVLTEWGYRSATPDQLPHQALLRSFDELQGLLIGLVRRVEVSNASD